MKKIGCDGKKPYKKRMAIMTVALMKKNGKNAHVYKCDYKNHWHITSMNPIQSMLSKKLVYSPNSKKIRELIHKAGMLNNLSNSL